MGEKISRILKSSAFLLITCPTFLCPVYQGVLGPFQRRSRVNKNVGNKFYVVISVRVEEIGFCLYRWNVGIGRSPKSVYFYHLGLLVERAGRRHSKKCK